MIVADGPIAHNRPDITLVDSIVKLQFLVTVMSDKRLLKRKINTQTYVLGSSGCGHQL